MQRPQKAFLDYKHAWFNQLHQKLHYRAAKGSLANQKASYSAYCVDNCGIGYIGLNLSWFGCRLEEHS